MALKHCIIALAGATAWSASVHAFDFDASKFSVNGFGTLGAVYSSEDQADFTGTSLKRDGAGFTHDISTDLDTNLGVQAVARFTDKLSATLQVVTEQNGYGKYKPAVEWANLKYAITPSLNVRIGRTAMPSYLYSDVRKVGYAIPWVRTPREVYDLLPISNSDGADISYRFRTGPVTNTVKAIYGENVTDVGNLEIKSKHVWGIFNTAEIGDLIVNLTYQEQKLYWDSYQTPNMWQQSADPVTFMALGASYDPGRWFVSGEAARRKIESLFLGGTIEAWYLSGGYRMRAVTTYATIADHNPKDQNLLAAYASDQRSYTLGARWDFMRNFNLKAEYQYFDLPRGSQGLLKVPVDEFFMPASSFQPGGSVDLLSVSLNFVF